MLIDSSLNFGLEADLLSHKFGLRVFKTLSFLLMFVVVLLFSNLKKAKFFYTKVQVSPLRVSPGAVRTSRTLPSERH